MKVKRDGRHPAGPRGRERVLVSADVPAARVVSVVMLACVLGWSTVLVARQYLGAGRVAPGRFGWSLALLAAVALIARGIFLGRPVTAGHAWAAAGAVAGGLCAHFLSFALPGNLMVAGAGAVLMWPTASRPQPDLLAQVWALVDATHADALAPFAMHSSKSYFFNAEGSAAIAYRARLGLAVVSGDPIGDVARFDDLVDDFVRMCRERGWRIIVLAAGGRRLGLWRGGAVRSPVLSVPIGHDVVVDVARFSLRGRRFRNLRQAVQRTRNCGVSVEIVDEQRLDGPLTAQLTEVLYAAHRAARTERGFCMNLDGALQGRFPGIRLAIARDRGDRVVAFHRYATAGHGSEISLDVPFRRPDAPNGVDERLSVEMILAAQSSGAQRLSLAFASFPEIFDAAHPSLAQRVAYRLIHLLDPLIRLESLYRYLCKFHAVGERRYVVLCGRDIPAALIVLLSLEFLPRPRRLRRGPNPAAAGRRTGSGDR
ncbi:bifunctional lysylphosphatidylglycerol flippase/synthetase MprF [Mycobacterium sp. THU-M116]